MRKTLGVLLIMLLVAAVLPARDLVTDQSPTSDTTGGRFESDFDNYLNPTGWSSLSSGILFLQFGGPDEDIDQGGNNGQFQAGTGFFLGGLYLGTELGTALPRTVTSNTNAESYSELLYDTDTASVIGIESESTSSTDERQLQDTDFAVLVGLSVGGIDIGIKNDFDWQQNNWTGTFEPEQQVIGTLGSAGSGDVYGLTADDDVDGKFEGTDGANEAITVGRTGGDARAVSTSTETVVRNVSGETTFRSVDSYGDEGYYNDSYFYDVLSVGASLPVAMLDLHAQLDLGVSFQSAEAEGSRTEYTTSYNTVFPDYSGVENAENYTSTKATEASSFTYVLPGLSVDATTDVNETVQLGFGVGYNLQTVVGDPATESFSYADYNATVNGDYIDTDVAETSISVEEEFSWTRHIIDLPVGVEVTPSDRFRYAVQYRPRILLRSESRDISGSFTETDTADPGDPSQPTVVTTRRGTFESSAKTIDEQRLQHNLNLGAQFSLTEKIRVNLGTVATMDSLRRTTTSLEYADNATFTVTEQVGDNDAVTTAYEFDDSMGNTDSKTVVNAVQDEADVQYSVGMTYFFSENMELDLEYDADNGSIFDLGVWSALMTIRY